MKGIAIKLPIKTSKGVRESEVNLIVPDNYDVRRLDRRALDEKQKERAAKFEASWLFRR